MTIKASFAASSLWVVAGTVAGNLSVFLIFAVLARLLRPSEIGLVMLALICIELALMLAAVGIPDALVQRPEWDDALASTAFWANLLLAVLIACGTAGVALGLPGWFPPGFAAVLAALSAAFVVDAARTVHEAKLRREFRFREIAGRTVIGTTLGGAVGIALALGGWGVWALVAQRLCSSLVQTVLTWLAARWAPAWHFSWAELRPIVAFGLPLVVAQLASYANARVSELALGIVAGPAAVAYFAVGRRGLDLLVQLTILPLQATALSALARLDDRAAVARAFQRVTGACALATAPAFLGAAVLAPDLVRVCFGPQWGVSGQVMSLLALVVGAATLRYFVGPALVAVGHARVMLRANLVMLGGSLLVASLTAPFGVVAVAGGQTAAAYLGLPLALGFLRRGIGAEPRAVLGGIVVPMLAAAAMALVLLAARTSLLSDWGPGSRIMALAPLGALVYAAILAVAARRYLRRMLGELGGLLPAPWRGIQGG